MPGGRTAGWGALALLIASSCDARGCVDGPRSDADAPASRDPDADLAVLAKDGEVGTAHPILVEQVDPAGRWAVVCQPRADTTGDGSIEATVGTHGELTGDGSAPYLVLDDPAGVRIDAYVAHDPTGRYVAVVQGDELVLFDGQTGERERLEGESTDDEEPFLPHRAAVFDPSGVAVAFTRTVDGSVRVVVRTLATGRERSIDPGPGRLFRVALAAGGESVGLHVVTRDTNHDGDIELPTTVSSIAPRGCRAGGSYTVMGTEGDEPNGRIVSLATTDATDVGPIESALGDGWVVRRAREAGEDDGPRALDLVSAEGARAELAPTSCNGEVLVVDHRRQRALVGCHGGAGASSGGWMPLELHDLHHHAPLGLWLDPSSTLGEANRSDRLVRVNRIRTDPHGPDRAALVDLEEPGRTILLGEGEIALGAHGSRILVQRGSAYLVRDLATEHDVPLGEWERDRLHFPLRAGRFVWVPPRLVDLDAARVVARLDVPATFGLTDGGRVLSVSPDAPTPEPRALWTGPLWWSGRPPATSAKP